MLEVGSVYSRGGRSIMYAAGAAQPWVFPRSGLNLSRIRHKHTCDFSEIEIMYIGDLCF